MYHRPILAQKKPAARASEVRKFNSPTAGWISNRNIAAPNDGPQGAQVLDNFFPTATTAYLRRGKELYATLGGGDKDVTAIFTYVNGLNRKIFASTETTIYDITNVPVADNYALVTENGDYLSDENGNHFAQLSTYELEVYENTLGGNWIVVQFATSGGIFLVGVNGESDGFVYDGTAFWPYVNGGVWALSYDNETVPFTVGELVTGGTSGATGTIIEIIAGGGLVLTGNAGGFVDNETLTGSLGGTADASSVSENLAPGVVFPSGLTSANMAYVWVYKNRLWFIQRDSLNAYYMDNIDAIGGTPKLFPLGGIMQRGGHLMWGDAWSLSSGASGGLSDQMVICSSEGEVSVFQGTFPEDLQTWSVVGTYRIGVPLGRRAHFRGGGDIAAATTIGLTAVSQTISLDVTAMSTAAVSYNIQDAWQQAVDSRGMDNWECCVWPEKKMAMISPPPPIGDYDPVVFVSNTDTGAWCRFTNWDARCMAVFQGQLYFGSPEGKVFKANVSGADEGKPFTGRFMPLYDDFGTSTNIKVPKMARAVTRGASKVNYSIRFTADFKDDFGAAPSATNVESTNVWGLGEWGSSSWGVAGNPIITDNWKSVGGIGYACSLAYQVTSGGIAPLDAEIIRLEMTYTTGEVLS